MKAVEITYRFESEEGPARGRPTDAAAALRRMNEGSRAFAEMFVSPGERSETVRSVVRVDPRDVGIQPGGTGSPEQRPFAAVLGCSDARVPVGLIFNEGPNDLFVVRVAGNTLGDDVRGSLNYALEHLGGSLKLIVVLGHSGCGAVTAAVDVLLNPEGYLILASKHAVRLVVDRLLVVVHAAARRMEEAFGPDITRHPRYREALIEVSVITNAALAAHTLQRQIGGVAEDGVRTAYGAYGIAERMIWAPRCGSDEVVGLATPPPDGEAFVEFGSAVLHSTRIAALLGSPQAGGRETARRGALRGATE
jgi:carbonic anhydrase